MLDFVLQIYDCQLMAVTSFCVISFLCYLEVYEIAKQAKVEGFVFANPGHFES